MPFNPRVARHRLIFIGIGLPVFAIVVALIVNLVQITGIKADVSGLRGEMSGLRGEANTKLDMILAKFYEHDIDVARLKDKTGLR